MNSSIAKVLSHVYELEGLLLVAEKHGVETPEMVFDRIHRVAQELSGMAQMLEYKAPPATVAPSSAPAPPPRPVAPAPVPEPVAPVQKLEPVAPVQKLEPVASVQKLEPVAPVQKPEPVAPVQKPEPVAQPVLRVDEQLQRHLSQDLRNAFSLNDRFRFKRSLFGNDEAQMEQAIDRVEKMHSEQEARDYFINTLKWDVNDPDVADFLQIVSSHFA